MNQPRSLHHCMIVLAYYPLGETRVQREAETLVAQGHRVDVLCLRDKGEPAEETFKGVHIYRLPARIRKTNLVMQFVNYLYFMLLAALKLARLHQKTPYDSVQAHNLPDFLVFAALWPKLHKVPVLLDLHDLMPEFYSGRFSDGSHRWLLKAIRWQERISCRFADHVITVSDHWREALIARGVPPEKCSVVMNVADQSIFSYQPKPPRQPDDPNFSLIYHGTLVYRYGLDLAIRAVDMVRDEIPGIRLTILGRGKHVPALRELRHELGLEEHVMIYEELRPAEELPSLIRTADAGVVPYRDDMFTDGLLPTKLMEYAALGLPALASRTTAMQRYFSGTMVEFFTPGDAEDLARGILRLYRSPQLMAKLAEGCQIFNQRYNWQKVGASYVALIESLAQNARGKRNGNHSAT